MGARKSKPASTGGGGGDTGGGGGGGGSAETTTTTKSSKKGATESGAYLIFTTDSGGVLTLHWSDVNIPGALAFFMPKKTVPEFKKTQNAGRLELIRNMGATKTKFLEGITHFIKEAAAYDADVKILSNDMYELWTCSGSSVAHIKKGDSFSTSKVSAVGCFPNGHVGFKGVKSIDQAQFVGTAIREGAVWKR
jgi:hypothetical protein